MVVVSIQCSAQTLIDGLSGRRQLVSQFGRSAYLGANQPIAICQIIDATQNPVLVFGERPTTVRQQQQQRNALETYVCMLAKGKSTIESDGSMKRRGCGNGVSAVLVAVVVIINLVCLPPWI